jgi:N-acetylglucosamine kinase-like BadF-type ATPase
MREDVTNPLVLGVDGGQTSTKCVLATIEGRVLAEGQGGPLIHLAAEGGRERFVTSLGEAIGDAWRRAGVAPRPVAAIGLGLTGVEADGPEAHVVAELLPRVVEAGKAEIQSDAVSALVGAHAGQPGVIAIAGTGSVVLGQNRRGVRQRAGGWGWLLGDEGSAMAIGRDGLMAALQAIDGVGPPTTLRTIFLQHFGVSRPRDVKNVVYAPDFGARGFGQLAPLVSRAAADGDAVACTIVARHADLLARDVRAVVRALDFGADPIPVAPLGGAFEHVTGLRDGFVRTLAAADSHLVVRPPLLPPTLGAVLLALEAIGAASSGARERLGEWASKG